MNLSVLLQQMLANNPKVAKYSKSEGQKSNVIQIYAQLIPNINKKCRQ